MASRDPLDLYEPLRMRWFWLRTRFMELYPEAPEPRLSCTYRSGLEQQEQYDKGNSDARPGESLHNFKPAYAFDVFFNDDKGTPLDKSDDVADWDFKNFTRFGQLAESIGLEWGGRWPNLVDGPHVQMPMTWQDAVTGRIPTLPPFGVNVAPVEPAKRWMIVVGEQPTASGEVLIRVRPSTRRVYVRGD